MSKMYRGVTHPFGFRRQRKAIGAGCPAPWLHLTQTPARPTARPNWLAEPHPSRPASAVPPTDPVAVTAPPTPEADGSSPSTDEDSNV